MFVRNSNRAILNQHKWPLSEERQRFSCCALKPTSQNGIFRRDLMLLGLTSLSLTLPLSGISLVFFVWFWCMLWKYEILRTRENASNMWGGLHSTLCHWDTTHLLYHCCSCLLQWLLLKKSPKWRLLLMK